MIYIDKDPVLTKKLEDLLSWCRKNDIEVSRVDDFWEREVIYYFTDISSPDRIRLQYYYQDVVTNPDYIKEKLNEYFGR